jgi:hypothetical protein
MGPAAAGVDTDGIPVFHPQVASPHPIFIFQLFWDAKDVKDGTQCAADGNR